MKFRSIGACLLVSILILAVDAVQAQEATPAATPAAARPALWSDSAFFGLHYDLHANASDTELGSETTPEHIRAMLEKVKPEFVSYDCKGHPGYASYPTKVGVPAPNQKGDMLRVWRDVTREMGIPLSIHFSGVWDTQAIKAHPDWANIDAAGKASENYTCPLSDYTDHYMIPQLLEVVELYDIDGVWIDGENWASFPCYCPRCTAEWTRRTGRATAPKTAGEEAWAEWLAMHRELFVGHVDRYRRALQEKKPALAVCSNWMFSVRQPDPVSIGVDYLSGDFNPAFGADRAAAESRFMSQQGKPWNLMAWGFLSLPKSGFALKPLPHLCQEVSEVLAQGGAIFVYNLPQRSGRLTAWHQDRLGEVADYARRLKPWCFQSETVPQVAVLHSQTWHYRNQNPLFGLNEKELDPMEGALHALLENGYSVDILNETMLLERLDRYPVLVVAEQDGLPAPVMDKIRGWVAAGGRLMLSGAKVAAEWGDLAGVEARPDAQANVGSYVAAGGEAVVVNGPWQAVKPTSAREIAPLLNQQDPAFNQTGLPSATLNAAGQGRVLAIHGGVFNSYLLSHFPWLRRYIGDCMAELTGDMPAGSRLMRVQGPWWIELAARRKDGRLLLQLVNRGSATPLSPSRAMVEAVAPTGPFTVTVPLAKRPRRCMMQPDATPVDWSWRDGLLTARVAELGIHNVLVVEQEP